MYNDVKELVDKIGDILCKEEIYISTAESCTGGMVAAELISYSGISKVYLEGAITYSNESKIKRLNVNKYTLEQFGAVSEETAKEMVVGISKVSGSKAAIVTTGIAGPEGGTKEKPVGLVYIGVLLEDIIKVNKFIFNGNRESIRRQSTENALKMLIEVLGLKGYK